jgi:uncharacterized protein with ATP-grasp and redox domains
MKMYMNTECLLCHLERNVQLARKLGSEEKATAFAKELMKQYISAPEGLTSPHFAEGTERLLRQFYGVAEDRYLAEKQESNRFILERMEDLRSRVQAEADPVLAGLKFSILGNYIDFSALRGNVSFRMLEEMIASALEMELDADCYEKLRGDLKKAKKLLYLTDNAGEIGFDRIFAEMIAAEYPQLEITFCVRGGPAMNDATRTDAAAVGIPFPVIDNGTCVPGTALDRVNAETLHAVQTADVIISKGMGNVETLLGCGYNVYYAFLVKCQRFVSRFHRPLMTPMLVRELDQEV